MYLKNKEYNTLVVRCLNILRKYLGSFGKQGQPVDGFMAHPLDIKYKPDIHVAHGFIL